MTGVTDAGGVYRFPSLVPGTYSVKVELRDSPRSRARTSSSSSDRRRRSISSMKVATLAENVTVTGASPVVDTTSANVNVNLSEQLLQGTPGGRDIWALVEYKVPSLLITRPDVGGTSGGLQGTYTARGTTSGQNSQYPERHQRRRSERHRRRRLLLRFRRVRRHPGVDRRARHHRADRRRLPEHGDQGRRQHVGRPDDVRMGGQPDAELEHRR